jgi:hypothetical protein
VPVEPEITGHDHADAGEAEHQPDPSSNPGALAEHRAGRGGHQQRLHGGDQGRGAGGHAQPDAGDDPAQVQALAEQAERSVAQQRPRAQPGAQHGREPGQHGCRHDVAPSEQGVGGRVPRAELGSDETRAPQHDERRSHCRIRASIHAAR